MKNKKTFHHARKETVLAAVLVFLVIVVMLTLAPWRKQNVSEVAKVTEVTKVRRLLDGVLVEQGSEAPPFAGVMVENMIEAQPISGLANANLVFEALTEANITRFLAYFVLDDSGGKASGAPEALPPNIEIGPVRSARPYYLDWASEFDTLYAHVGSSPAAYALLRTKGVEGVHDLDQWYKSEYFKRVNDGKRYVPHNVFTSSELLKKAYNNLFPERSARGVEGPHFEPWKFKGDAPPDVRGNVSDIKIGYVAPYNVQWLYDKSLNLYKRMQWARPNSTAGGVSVGQDGTHRDANGKAIVAKNIAVAFQEMKVLDEIGRKQFTTIGEGKGLVFQDGRVIVGIWKKPEARQRLRFYDVQGNEVEFNAGITWVKIVPTDYSVSY